VPEDKESSEMLKHYKQLKVRQKLTQQPLIQSLMKLFDPKKARIPGPTSRGFTLIEIIMVIVILSIVSAITIYFLVNSLKGYTMTVNQKTLFDEGRLALERMCRDIRDAKTITTPAPNGSGNTLTFIRTNATAQDSADETITFTLSGSTLVKVKASNTYAMAENIFQFNVTRDSGSEMLLRLVLQRPSGEQVTMETKVYPKNLPESSTYKNFFGNWREELSS